MIGVSFVETFICAIATSVKTKRTFVNVGNVSADTPQFLDNGVHLLIFLGQWRTTGEQFTLFLSVHGAVFRIKK